MKQLTINYDGKKYVLEYTRRTVAEMESEGFITSKIDEMPMTLIPMLFAGAFKAHHRLVRDEMIDEIYKMLPNKDKLIAALAEMYKEPLASLMEEPDEEDEGNAEWTANW